ncbi:MAG: bifunctional phosphopantothenoylcysteine decarboxylase/phosphopantothenate--cysteine ligase CoaBC [Bacteroidales bacterium]|nr:bifunctional phosphopantothenoylcysteine decarboxylase/phosphopantothenate--cysteine ligase CoaBC [Bacteroidales bacterium]
MMLRGKKILIGITASIAAYKIPILIRLLIKQGAEVKVVMTKAACDFVTPLTLSALSQNPVSIEPFSESDGRWHSHIELGSWADVYLIAPLSANTMAKMSTGITDNLLMATYLAARCPVFFAPAMDVDMFNHPTTQDNISRLVSFGNILIKPTEGELASGLSGFGRMEEPEKIVEIISLHFKNSESFKGHKFLITSGPTLEPIDPVRFISNHSSGQMGNALALEAANRGADVILISGPVKELPQHPGIQIIQVNTAGEMFEKCMEVFPDTNTCIMAAAVADYKPTQPAAEKIKKSADTITLALTRTKDILSELGKNKMENQLLIGFALETNHEIENARQKLYTKNLDFIVLNSLRTEGAGFGFSTNQISIIGKSGQVIEYEKKSKVLVACDILDYLKACQP